MKSHRPDRDLQVATYLWERRDRWTPGHEFSNEQIGGSEGRRRARDLRKHGFVVECHKMANSTEWEYQIS